MKQLKILGTGCPKCDKLTELTEQSAKELGIEFEIKKVTELNDIMKYNIMMTPGLVVDEKVVVSGKIPSVEEIKSFLI